MENDLSEIDIRLSNYKIKYDALFSKMRKSVDLEQLNSIYNQSYEVIDLNNDVLIDYSHLIKDKQNYYFMDPSLLDVFYNENLLRILKNEYDIFLFDTNSNNLKEHSVPEFMRKIDYYLLFVKSCSNNSEITNEIKTIKSNIL